jgi:hypothetical protein
MVMPSSLRILATMCQGPMKVIIDDGVICANVIPNGITTPAWVQSVILHL